MYFIQGADQKEYGPITAEQLRQWISESRLNRASLARSDADPAWKPLSQFPEFADAFGAGVPGPAPAGYAPAYSPASSPVFDNAEAEALVRPPAIAILVTSIIGVLFAVLGFVMNFMGAGANQPTPPGLPPEFEKFFTSYMDFAQKFGSLTNLLVIATSAVSILAAVRMMQFRSYGLVMAGVILAMLPCTGGCCCLGIPFGIWALVVLNKPEVKGAFR
jgi:hypothetical protein